MRPARASTALRLAGAPSPRSRSRIRRCRAGSPACAAAFSSPPPQPREAALVMAIRRVGHVREDAPHHLIGVDERELLLELCADLVLAQAAERLVEREQPHALRVVELVLLALLRLLVEAS